MQEVIGTYDMDPELIQKIANHVYRRFPEVQGKKPVVRKQNVQTKSAGTSQTFLLTFKGSANGPGGKVISRLVRVVVDSKGAILKITTSKGAGQAA